MKIRSPYGWIFAISGSLWAIGYAGLIAGYLLYPDSNLLGGFALVFAPISGLGSFVFIGTLLVWLVHKTIRKMRKPKTDEHSP